MKKKKNRETVLIPSGPIMIEENFNLFRSYKSDVFYMRNISFRLKEEVKLKYIDIYYDEGWKVTKLMEHQQGRKVEVQEPRRSLLAENFFSSEAVQKVLKEYEEMFRVIEYMNNADTIEFEKLQAIHSIIEGDDKQVDFVLRGFERFKLTAWIDEEMKEIELYFYFPWPKKLGSILFVKLPITTGGFKLIEAISNDRRSKIALVDK